jgi:hypothetical protein
MFYCSGRESNCCRRVQRDAIKDYGRKLVYRSMGSSGVSKRSKFSRLRNGILANKSGLSTSGKLISCVAGLDQS